MSDASSVVSHGHIGDRGPRANVNEYAFAAQKPRAPSVQLHFNGLHVGGPRFAHHEFCAASFEVGEVEVDQVLSQIVAIRYE
jgi:hypothetical protein